MKTAGAVLACSGLLFAAYYLWVFKTYTEPLEGEGMFNGMRLRIADADQTRQNGQIFGVGVAVVGTLLYGFSRKPG